MVPQYDFRKTTQDPNIGEFYHPYFKENRPELLNLIKRKANNRSRRDSDHHHDVSAVAAVGDDDLHQHLKSDNHHHSASGSHSLITESEYLLKELHEQKLAQQEFEKKFAETNLFAMFAGYSLKNSFLV